MADMVFFEDTAPWILGILFAYMALVIVIGIYYYQKIDEGEDHTLAGRGLSYPYVVASIVATWICSGALMGVAGYAYLGGMQAVIWDPWAPFLTLVVAGLFFVYKLRKLRYMSVVDVFRNRYGRFMEGVLLVVQLIGNISWVAGQLVALGIILNMTTGFSLELSIIIGMIAIIIVTYGGGLHALVRMDSIALLIIIAGLLLLFNETMDVMGGWTEFVNNARVAWDVPAFTMTIEPEPRGYLWYTGFYAIVLYIGAWIGVGFGDLGCATLMHRALSAKNEKTASAGFFSAGILYLILGLIPVMIGIAVYTYGMTFRADLAEYSLIWAASEWMPAVPAVIFMVGIGAAILSTSGNTIIAVATLAGHNVYGFFRPESTQQRRYRMIRYMIPVIALIALAIGLFFTQVYRLIIFAGAVGLPTVVAPYIAAFYWKKANNLGAIWSFILGTVSWAIIFVNVLPTTIDANMDIITYGEPWMEEAIWDAIYIAMVPSFVVAIIALIVVSLATQRKDPPKRLITPEGTDVADEAFFLWFGGKKSKGQASQQELDDQGINHSEGAGGSGETQEQDKES